MTPPNPFIDSSGQPAQPPVFARIVARRNSAVLNPYIDPSGQPVQPLVPRRLSARIVSSTRAWVVDTRTLEGMSEEDQMRLAMDASMASERGGLHTQSRHLHPHLLQGLNPQPRHLQGNLTQVEAAAAPGEEAMQPGINSSPTSSTRSSTNAT
ncbi:hypothetical protein TrCOL_g9427 [Triparma columacea]|uniref:Uncharacterized protein n=1 Tax=Triparma columacea TaxID=722753 RepID=A0A9W7GCV0_9STRA|nr:hypothetical protein TrCOL_g9427 [Triparma columacea]